MRQESEHVHDVLQRPLGTKMPKTMPSKKRFLPQAGARTKIKTVSPKAKYRKSKNEKAQKQIRKNGENSKNYKVKMDSNVHTPKFQENMRQKLHKIVNSFYAEKWKNEKFRSKT